MCNHLGVDQKNYFKLSNWICHVKQCVQEKEGKEKERKDKGQLELTKFFSNHSSSSKNASLISTSESELIRSDAADTGNDFSDKQGFQLAPPIAKKNRRG